MRANDIGLLVVYAALLLVAASYPLGLFMARLANAPSASDRRWVTSPERGLYRLAGIDRGDRHDVASQYAVAVIVFNALGALVGLRAATIAGRCCR